MFQWNEKKNEKSNCIMYNKYWSNAVVKSDGFSDLTKRNTVVRPQVEVGTDTVTCEVVNFGDAFLLPRDLVEQLSGFVNANVVLGKKVEGLPAEWRPLLFSSSTRHWPRDWRHACAL